MDRDQLQRRCSISARGGDGTFWTRGNYEVGAYAPESIAMGDLNAGGFPDLALACEASEAAAVMIGLGDGSFQPGRQLPMEILPRAIAIVGMDKNHAPDLAMGSSRVSRSTGDPDYDRGPDGTVAPHEP